MESFCRNWISVNLTRDRLYIDIELSTRLFGKPVRKIGKRSFVRKKQQEKKWEKKNK